MTDSKHSKRGYLPTIISGIIDAGKTLIDLSRHYREAPEIEDLSFSIRVKGKQWMICLTEYQISIEQVD